MLYYTMNVLAQISLDNGVNRCIGMSSLIVPMLFICIKIKRGVKHGLERINYFLGDR